MSLTQIPFQDPVTPEKPQPEQLGLYDRQGWETAYKELDDDARVPHLLIQLQDDLARSRLREAAWISVIVHLVLIILIFNFGKLESWFPWMHSVVAVARPLSTDKNVTFLDLPPDLQKAPHRSTNVLSDKDRIAMSRHPELDPKELRKILATPPPGRPGLNAPAAAPHSQPSPQTAQSPPQQRQPPPPPSNNQQIAQLQPPKPNIASEFSKYAGSMSAGSAVQQAARAVADGRASGSGQGGDFGLGTGAHGRQVGNLEILSDTQGVDFGPYLQRVLHDVRQNWYELIPESAQMKHGNLIIEFAIMKDGSVQGLRIVASSNDVALDRPAYGSITASNPFPALPGEFKGQYLALRFRFFYNPTKEEME
jgi:TonB family protein